MGGQQKILGIDPGTHAMGWGLVGAEKGGKIFPLKYGCIQSKPKTRRAESLLNIYHSLNKIIEENSPTILAIEQLFFFKNQTTVISVAEARGVAILAASLFGLKIFEYTPLAVKQALTGYGRADKRQVQEMVRLSCHLKACPKPDDAADALAIAICHAQTNRLEC